MSATKNVLVLNASYEALSVVSTERAVTLIMLERALLVEGTGALFSSQNTMVEVPSIIRLNTMVHAPRQMTVPLSRRALFARDRNECQYCGMVSGTMLPDGTKMTLEVEHVKPRSKGGKNVWENVVAACRACNGFKADRTPEEAGMTLRRKPFAPSRKAMIATRGNATWEKYLAA